MLMVPGMAAMFMRIVIVLTMMLMIMFCGMIVLMMVHVACYRRLIFMDTYVSQLSFSHLGLN